jgi:flagellar hook-basal body complex protein FliE
MSQMEIDRVVSQIRALRQAAGGPLGAGLRPAGLGEAPGGIVAPGGVPGANGPGGLSFGNVLRAGIERVNEAQQQSGASQRAFERGDPGVDLPQVMIDMQKASLAFRGAVEVRNRMVAAYQEIMNMPV